MQLQRSENRQKFASSVKDWIKVTISRCRHGSNKQLDLGVVLDWILNPCRQDLGEWRCCYDSFNSLAPMECLSLSTAWMQGPTVWSTELNVGWALNSEIWASDLGTKERGVERTPIHHTNNEPVSWSVSIVLLFVVLNPFAWRWDTSSEIPRAQHLRMIHVCTLHRHLPPPEFHKPNPQYTATLK